MMTRFVLTLLIGLVVSLGALVSDVEPVLAKNWNTEEGLKSNGSIELSGGFVFYELPSYDFLFKCSQDSDGEISRSVMRVTDKKLNIHLDQGYFMSLDKETDKVSTNISTTDAHEMAFLKQLKSTVKNYQELTPFKNGTAVNVGKNISLTQRMFGARIEVSLKPFKFVKYNGMTGVKSYYKARVSDNLKIGQENIFMDGVLEGVVINHLGTGLWVSENTQFTGTVNGQNFQFAHKRHCTLESEDDYFTGLASVASTAENVSNDISLEQDISEYQKEIQILEQELAALKSNKAKKQKAISSDTKEPIISASAKSSGQTNAVVSGKVSDNVDVAEVTVGGEVVLLTSDGSFETSFYIPRAGRSVEIVAFDTKGNKATKSLFIERGAVQGARGPVFASLNPSGKRVKPNKDALALIIGVADYERTPAKAAYADKDAKTFYDYALLKLGIPAGNIKELVNVDANRIDVGLAIKDWIARTTRQGFSDIYVFFAGHGLASQSGEQMYLLPYDGSPRLLEDSAISRERFFTDIASANPHSVTVFLDTCYSGTTRGTDMLIASRPIAIKALKQSIPDNFTVMTAAAGDQTAKPLEEAKHGMFSYFLMKGMEGEADQNQDNKITAGELHSYVQQNVVQQSSGSQTPELQGDAGRVLVRFQ